ncbi:bestrophin family protein [Paraburkholderia pallida]|uniref:Bestrophin n=1 Tax=Paraburkholderia pallida TaxID=2547399 RepID=A0A4P7D1T0_9BURK|nr:bestrophin family ion channel [Paraburkholderia pallida]QBR02589.1 hypothetical protein E1956_35785 [Paraburkholderia pallida]
MIIPGRACVGQLVRYVGRPLALLCMWDVVVTVAYLCAPEWITFPALPLSLFGSAIVVYLSFRNSAAYARWWEARTLLGAIVNYSRSFARELGVVLPAHAHALRNTLILRQVAYVHALRMHLRREPPWNELKTRLPAAEVERLLGVANVPHAILSETARIIAHDLALDAMRLSIIEHTLRELSNAQGGMERIRNTPIPQQYATYPTLFTHAFCLLLPLGLVQTLGVFTPIGSTGLGFLLLALLRIGDDIAEPFSKTVNDVPLTAVTRTIEIDLLDSLGDDHGLKSLHPEDGVLW